MLVCVVAVWELPGAVTLRSLGVRGQRVYVPSPVVGSSWLTRYLEAKCVSHCS